MLERHIVMGGSSFTGSTLFSLVLGALDGFDNVGESDWLTPKLGEATNDPSLFSNYNDLHQCRLCGPSCEIWTHAFRRDLQSNPEDWYQRIADQMGARNLISSEKAPWTIKMLDPDLRNTTLVLFKSPFQHWASFSKRPWRKKSMNAAMNTWSRIYSDFLDEAKYAPKGGKVFVNLEKFLSKPEANLYRFTEALNVPYDPGILQYWKTQQHYMGGNFSVYERIKKQPEMLPVTNSMNPINEVDQSAIEQHGAFKVYQRLLKRSIV